MNTDTAAYIETDTFTSHAAEEHASRVIVAHTPIRTVTIPARAEHEGIYSRAVRLVWKCPVCGAPRAEPGKVLSYDGSRRLVVDGWINTCGHIDKYAAVCKEADANGLNSTPLLALYPEAVEPGDTPAPELAEPLEILGVGDVVFVCAPRRSFYGRVLSIHHAANAVTVRDLWGARPAAEYPTEDVKLICKVNATE